MAFLSTPSARRATQAARAEERQAPISIHALREEGDKLCEEVKNKAEYFYPRPPRGGRRGYGVAEFQGTRFLSTPSARRATCAGCRSG